MRIAINGRFLSAKHQTGVERVAFELVKRLPLIDKANSYFILADSNATLKPQLLKIKNLTWVDFPFSAKSLLLKHLQEQLLLPRKIKSLGIDLLFNPTNTAPLSLLGRSVSLIHCLHVFSSPGDYKYLFRKYYHWLLPIVAKKSLALTTISGFSAKEIKQYIGLKNKPINIIPNGVDDKFFKPSKTSVARQLNLNKKYILFVGSLNPRKNLERLAKAYLSSAICDKYDLVAVGNEIGRFKKIKKDPRIKFVSGVNDSLLVALYQQATLFAFPSLHEGFGLPPLEAMAAGTPVMVSNIPTLKEICGEAAYYVNPKSVTSIKQGLNTLLADNTKLLDTLAKAGSRQAMLFSWDNAAKAYATLFNSII